MASATNDLAGALQDVRKMRRSIQLREESDPAKVAETLTTILREAIAVRSANGGRLGRGAVNELKNIRRALVAEQIDAGSKTGEFIGKYSAVLDQITDVEKESRSKTSPGASVGSALAQNLPSADMITSALITANPILGYSTKIVTDLFRGQRNRRAFIREEQRKRLENLAKEEERLEQEAEQVSEDENSDDGILHKLDLIREEIHILNKTLNQDVNDNLEAIHETTEKEMEILDNATDSQRLLSQERAYESSSFDSNNALISKESQAAQGEIGDLNLGQFGLMSGVGGAIGGIASKLLSPFIGLLTFIKHGGSMLGRLGRVTGLLTAAYAIYDFVGGFMNAGDIVGKEESQLTVGDKIRAGFSSVVSGLLAPVDWLLDFFDMGFMDDREQFTRDIASGIESLIDFIKIPINKVTEFIQNFSMEEMINSIKESIGDAFDSVTDKFNEIGQAIENWIQSKIDAFKETWIGKQIEGIADALSTENDLSRAIDEQGGYYRGMPQSSVEEPATIKSAALQAALRVVDRVEASPGGNGSSTIIAPNSQTNVNNTTIDGSSGSKNNDRTWRDLQRRSNWGAW